MTIAMVDVLNFVFGAGDQPSHLLTFSQQLRAGWRLPPDLAASPDPSVEAINRQIGWNLPRWLLTTHREEAQSQSDPIAFVVRWIYRDPGMPSRTSQELTRWTPTGHRRYYPRDSLNPGRWPEQHLRYRNLPHCPIGSHGRDLTLPSTSDVNMDHSDLPVFSFANSEICIDAGLFYSVAAAGPPGSSVPTDFDFRRWCLLPWGAFYLRCDISGSFMGLVRFEVHVQGRDVSSYSRRSVLYDIFPDVSFTTRAAFSRDQDDYPSSRASAVSLLSAENHAMVMAGSLHHHEVSLANGDFDDYRGLYFVAPSLVQTLIVNFRRSFATFSSIQSFASVHRPALSRLELPNERSIFRMFSMVNNFIRRAGNLRRLEISVLPRSPLRLGDGPYAVDAQRLASQRFYDDLVSALLASLVVVPGVSVGSALHRCRIEIPHISLRVFRNWLTLLADLGSISQVIFRYVTGLESWFQLATELALNCWLNNGVRFPSIILGIFMRSSGFSLAHIEEIISRAFWRVFNDGSPFSVDLHPVLVSVTQPSIPSDWANHFNMDCRLYYEVFISSNVLVESGDVTRIPVRFMYDRDYYNQVALRIVLFHEFWRDQSFSFGPRYIDELRHEDMDLDIDLRDYHIVCNPPGIIGLDQWVSRD